MDHIISLTEAEESVLQNVAALQGVSADQIVEVAKTALVNQTAQYLAEQAVNRVKAMSNTEKIDFLNS